MVDQSKKYRMGAWCRRGAWLVAALGLAQIAGLILNRYATYPLLAPGVGTDQLFLLVTPLLQPTFSILANTIFYFLVLYAIGYGCDHFFGQAAPQLPPDFSEEDEVICTTKLLA